jgi:hypothetical protein
MQSRDFARWLAPTLLEHPGLCKLLTRGTLAAEAAIPLLLWSPFFARASRALGIAIDLMLFAGIFTTMAVGNFPAVMSTAMVLFLLPEWLDSAEQRLRIAAHPREREASPSPRPWVIAIVAVQMLLVITQVSELRFARWFWQAFASELSVMGLAQAWPMFARGMPHQGRWSARGELSDGSEIDVFAAVAPQMNSLGDKTRYSRWYKMRFGLAMQRDYTLYDALAIYLCRRFNGIHRPHLKRMEIFYDDESVPDPGVTTKTAERLEMYRGACDLDPPERSRGARAPGITPPPP